MKKNVLLFLSLIILYLSSCDDGVYTPGVKDEPYILNSPSHFPPPIIPSNNPLTKNKVRLGRMLFYDAQLSEDKQISCASCHKQQFAFSDNTAVSKKVNHGSTTRNSMALFNLVYTNNYFWDGRTGTLESTCLDALLGEQNFDINRVAPILKNNPTYLSLFKLVYGNEDVTQDQIVKALASFIRTMISAGTRLDKGAKEGLPEKYLTPNEILGKSVFDGEINTGGDCFHCHGSAKGNPLFTDNEFHNNGLDNFNSYSQFTDKGKGAVTGLQTDYGKFKTGTLRNLSFTGPYMHDGRFSTLDEVLNHYNTGVKNNITIDPNMKKANVGGLQLPQFKLDQLKAYLLMLNDVDFIRDTSFSNPF